MMGGGFGGCTINIVKKEIEADQEDILEESRTEKDKLTALEADKQGEIAIGYCASESSNSMIYASKGGRIYDVISGR